MATTANNYGQNIGYHWANTLAPSVDAKHMADIQRISEQEETATQDLHNLLGTLDTLYSFLSKKTTPDTPEHKAAVLALKEELIKHTIPLWNQYFPGEDFPINPDDLIEITRDNKTGAILKEKVHAPDLEFVQKKVLPKLEALKTKLQNRYPRIMNEIQMLTQLYAAKFEMLKEGNKALKEEIDHITRAISK